MTDLEYHKELLRINKEELAILEMEEQYLKKAFVAKIVIFGILGAILVLFVK